jgi:hypothetical protein
MPPPVARFLVHARRVSRGPAARAARRAVGMARRTLVFGVAPAMASDALVDHTSPTAFSAMHDLATSAAASALAAGVHDIMLLARAMRL